MICDRYTRCKKLKTTDKLMRKQLINPLLKIVKTSKNSKINDMLVPSKTTNKKKLQTPLLVPPKPSTQVSSIMLVPSKTRNKKKSQAPMLVPARPSTKVSSIAGELLGDCQSSPKVQSLAGSVLRLTRPWYFPGKMKP